MVLKGAKQKMEENFNMKHEGPSLSVVQGMGGEALWLHFDWRLTSASLLFVFNPGNQKYNLPGLRGKKGTEDDQAQYFF